MKCFSHLVFLNFTSIIGGQNHWITCILLTFEGKTCHYGIGYFIFLHMFALAVAASFELLTIGFLLCLRCLYMPVFITCLTIMVMLITVSVYEICWTAFKIIASVIDGVVLMLN